LTYSSTGGMPGGFPGAGGPPPSSGGSGGPTIEEVDWISCQANFRVWFGCL